MAVKFVVFIVKNKGAQVTTPADGVDDSVRVVRTCIRSQQTFGCLGHQA